MINCTTNTANNTEPKKLPISRYRIDGKRVMVLYAHDLATTCLLSWSTITELLRSSQLRKSQDYLYDPEKEDFVLSLAAAQAIAVMANTDNSWRTHHKISDFIRQIKRRK